MIINNCRPIRTFFLLTVGIMLSGCGAVPIGAVKTDSPLAATATLATILPRALPSKSATMPPAATERLPAETPYPTAQQSIRTPQETSCADEKVDDYLAVVLPLADQHVLDSKQAEKMSSLNPNQKEAYRQAAEERLASIIKMTPPTCLQAVHAQLVSAFERLIRAWDYGLESDFENSRLMLMASYNEIVEVIAELAGYR